MPGRPTGPGTTVDAGEAVAAGVADGAAAGVGGGGVEAGGGRAGVSVAGGGASVLVGTGMVDDGAVVGVKVRVGVGAMSSNVKTAVACK
jgi:hypothetical protein